MKVDEYKEKFIALFKQLYEEQGRVKRIAMSSEEMIDMIGNPIGLHVECEIVFE